MVAVPDVGSVRPTSIRSVDDLPAPLAPRNPVILPGSTLTLRSSTACTGPYRLVRWSKRINAMLAAPVLETHRGVGLDGRPVGRRPASACRSQSGLLLPEYPGPCALSVPGITRPDS